VALADKVLDRLVEMAGELVVEIAIRGVRTHERAETGEEPAQSGPSRVHESAAYSLRC
jgi:hypothetical protein